MALLDPFKTFLQSQYSLLVMGVLGLLVIALAAYGFGWGAALFASSWFWVVVVLLLAVGLFVGIRWGVPRLREWYFLRGQGSEYVAAGQESPEEFQAKFLKALHTLKGLPQLKGKGDPLYVLPWYLLIGESGSGKTAALRGADLFSPLLPPPGGGGATQNCDWWVSNAAVILDTTGRYALPVDMARDRAEWYRLLRLLHRHRGQEPINGVVIAVAADGLALQPSEEKLRADASKLRERLEEVVRELGVDFPVYLLITKCDLLEGFREFFTQLPERVLGEVIGYVDDSALQSQDGGQPLRGMAALRRVSAGLQSIYDRLHLFRLSLLESKAPEALRQAIFCFPEEFRALQRPLTIFLEPLFSEDVRYHTPLFRGIFFTSAQQQGVPFSLLRRQLHLADETVPLPGSSTHSFLRDVFDTMLPRDRALARTTARAQKRRWLTRVSGLFVGAGLVLFLTVLLFRGFATDRHITSAVNPALCQEAMQKVPTRPRLDEAAGCLQVIQNLIEQNRQRPRWSTLVFRRSFQLEEELRQRYVRRFRIEVLTPLNADLDRSFQGNTDPLPLILLLARRVRLSQRCLPPEGCPESVADDLLQSDSPLMLNPQRDQRLSPQEVTKLREAYTAYLLWQREPKAELRQDVAEDSQRLQRWLSAKQFDPDQLLAWVNKRSPPITYEHYWELPAPITTVAAPQIDAACTGKVWGQDIAPFLQQIQDAVPEVGPQLHTFQQKYLSTCFVQWQHFLAGFPRGAERWKGPDRRQTLALRLLTESSPYQRVVEEASANLALWLPAEGDTTATPSWTGPLRSYVASEQQKAYQDALSKISGQLGRPPSPEACMKLAQEAFAEGKPAEGATSPVLRAWWLATQPRQTGRALQKPDEDIWGPLLWEPVRYVWRFILEEAGRSLQKSWSENVIAPLKGLPPAEQAIFLYGPGGKVDSFVQQFVRPFLMDEGSRAATVLGEGVPFSPRFLQLLSDAKQIKSVFEGGNVPQPVQVRATRRAEIEGRPTLLEDETVLSIACAARTYRVTDRARDPAEATAAILWSYQSCGEVAITIYVSERGQGPGGEAASGTRRFQLTKRYTGQMGFLYFLHNFLGGSHRFPIDDLASANPDVSNVRQSGVNAIQVYYYVEVPPALGRLALALQEATLPDKIISPSAPLT